MAKNKSIVEALKLIKDAIDNQRSLNKLCVERGKRRNFVSNISYELDVKLDSGTITADEYHEFRDAYTEYLQVKDTFKEKAKKRLTAKPDLTDHNFMEPDDFDDGEDECVDYDASDDDAYDERSKGEILRDLDDEITLVDGTNVGKITGYRYDIKIKGEQDLVGTLSREEMDTVYRLYTSMDGAGLTQRAVSRVFPHLTFRDFKRILRAFNITKQSIAVAPHVLEENDLNTVVDIVFRNKENNLLKKIEELRAKKTEQILVQTQKELLEWKQKAYDVQNMVNEIVLEDIEPMEIEKKSLDGEEVAMMIYISDQHVGADTTENSVYINPYDEEEFRRRLKITLEQIRRQHSIYGRFDKIVICNLGDSLDGWDKKTTRGGHDLKQNMDNKKQYNVYVNSMLNFFDTLHGMDVTNSIDYYCVGDDNHSGDFGYIANKSLEMVMRHKYTDMYIEIFEKFIEFFTYGKHTFILTHGKDKEDRRNGFPLNLDVKTENYFNEFILYNEITSPVVHVVKGDLHQTSTNFGKRFRYKNVASMYGSSKWIHNNFGNTKAAVDYDIVFKNSKEFLEGRIDLV